MDSEEKSPILAVLFNAAIVFKRCLMLFWQRNSENPKSQVTILNIKFTTLMRQMCFLTNYSTSSAAVNTPPIMKLQHYLWGLWCRKCAQLSLFLPHSLLQNKIPLSSSNASNIIIGKYMQSTKLSHQNLNLSTQGVFGGLCGSCGKDGLWGDITQYLLQKKL